MNMYDTMTMVNGNTTRGLTNQSYYDNIWSIRTYTLQRIKFFTSSESVLVIL